MNVLKITNMKFIPYTQKDSLEDWIKSAKNKKKRNKQYSHKVHKNINAR